MGFRAEEQREAGKREWAGPGTKKAPMGEEEGGACGAVEGVAARSGRGGAEVPRGAAEWGRGVQDPGAGAPLPEP